MLIQKCWHYGVPARAIAFLEAYPAERSAKVVVGGSFSEAFPLKNQVFQGTVLGPKLWNTFFADIKNVLTLVDLILLLFADDLNAYKLFPRSVSNEVILEQLKRGQSECHKWGSVSQVEFERTKEIFTVIDKDDPFGPGFKLLGIFFDPVLSMQLTLNILKGKVDAKLRCLFRIRKFYSLKQYLTIYKTQIWSSLEWATPGIFHCTKTQLDVLDGVQRRFLSFVRLSPSEAFLSHNLAPLSLRRSIAMLGFI